MNDLLLISGVINFIMMICIFVMGANIGSIKRMLANQSGQQTINYSGAYVNGELKEYQGKPTEALDNYREALFLINKFIAKGKTGQAEVNNKKMIEDKIISLGGKI